MSHDAIEAGRGSPLRRNGGRPALALDHHARLRPLEHSKGLAQGRHRRSQTAAREAFEEAGIKGEVGAQPIGSFRYAKRLHLLSWAKCSVDVYLCTPSVSTSPGQSSKAAARCGCIRTRPLRWFGRHNLPRSCAGSPLVSGLPPPPDDRLRSAGLAPDHITAGTDGSRVVVSRPKTPYDLPK